MNQISLLINIRLKLKEKPMFKIRTNRSIILNLFKVNWNLNKVKTKKYSLLIKE
jgi:hypothetical protein